MILKTITLVSNWESYTWLADGSHWSARTVYCVKHLKQLKSPRTDLIGSRTAIHTTLTKAMLKRQNRSTRLSKPSPRNWHHEKEKPVAHSVCCCRTSSYVVYLVLGWRISTRIRENVVSLNPSERNATFQLKRALKAEDECRALLDALERKDRLLDSLRKAFELVRKDVLNPEELNALGKLRIEAITKEIGA